MRKTVRVALLAATKVETGDLQNQQSLLVAQNCLLFSVWKSSLVIFSDTRSSNRFGLKLLY